MRFMLLVRASPEAETGAPPDERTRSELCKFNEAMIKAGVMLAADGLMASSKGARVRFSGTTRTVVDGPFAESQELVAGYWLLQVRSKEEAIEWARRAPFRAGEIEIRQVVEPADFQA